MSTNSKKSEKKATSTVTSRAKVSTGAKRAVKRERVAMVKTPPSAPDIAAAPTAPTAAPTTPRSAPAEAARSAKPAPMAPAAPAHDSTPAREALAPVRTISSSDLQNLVRREAYKLAQRRQFRAGSPVKDWFDAEAMVKAQLSARGVTVST